MNSERVRRYVLEGLALGTREERPTKEGHERRSDVRASRSRVDVERRVRVR